MSLTDQEILDAVANLDDFDIEEIATEWTRMESPPVDILDECESDDSSVDYTPTVPVEDTIADNELSDMFDDMNSVAVNTAMLKTFWFEQHVCTVYFRDGQPYKHTLYHDNGVDLGNTPCCSYICQFV